MEQVGACIDKDSYAFVHILVKACHQFRDPDSGVAHPRLESVLQMKHLTAERRVRAIFYFAHVLGTKAEVIAKPELRQHALIVISTLQLLLIAVRGHRAYTRRELDVIFEEVGQQFWMSMERIAAHVERARVIRGQRRHEQRPTSTRPPVAFKRMRRDPDDSDDTVDTDDDHTWGGDGMYELSQKGLPHALLHFAELVMRGGHALAFCSCVAESSHKHCIKSAARLSRTYASVNISQEHMLMWSCRQKLWGSVIKRVRDDEDDEARAANGQVPHHIQPAGRARTSFRVFKMFKGSLGELLEPPTLFVHAWESVFLSAKIRVTRREVVTILCSKLSWAATRTNRRRLVNNLRWTFYGTLSTHGRHVLRRKFVGVGTKSAPRRDFVRVMGPPENNTCLTAQILVFVHIVGFGDDIVLPQRFRNPVDNSVVFALVRWLSPHQDALIRDSELRPIAPSPLDINHALWKFSETQRPLLSQSVIDSNLHCYDGTDTPSRLLHANRERTAMFDLLEPETFEYFVNCTEVNADKQAILETITLPFT
jgi:hypothetical protein